MAAHGLAWQLSNTYQTLEDAEAYIASQDVRKQRSGKTKDFKKVTYFCRCCRSHGCPLQLRLDIPWSGGACNLYYVNTHNHASPSTHGLPTPVKRKVEEGILVGLQPHQIKRSIAIAGLPLPEGQQLKNQIHRTKVAKYGPGSLTTGAFQKWCDDRKFTAQMGLDDPFVSMYYPSQEKLFFHLTTRRLTEKSCKTPMLHVDATYKLTWEGYPVIITGTSHRNGAFHLSGVALIWSDEDHEAYRSILEAVAASRALCGLNRPIKYVMADGVSSLNLAITQSLYPDAKRFMCWAHAKRAMRDKKSKLGHDWQQKWPKVEAALTILQSSPSKELFDRGVELFLNNIINIGGAEFAKYFQQTWVNSNLYGWYEGVAPLLASHNNQLECFNRRVKQQYTYHTQCRLPEFLSKMDIMVREVSCEQKPFAEVPYPEEPLSLETVAFQWSRSSSEIHVGGGSNGKPLYMVKGSKCTLSAQQFLQFKNQPSSIPDWKTFEAVRNSWHYVYRHDGGFSVCDCPVGLKDKTCKHSLGIDILYHGHQVSAEARDLPIGHRRGKGRPRAVGGRYDFQ